MSIQGTISKQGMTLIEVMIALAIFAMIAVFSIATTKSGMTIRNKLSVEADYYNGARTLLRHMDTDISLAYHAYKDTKLGEYYKQTVPGLIQTPGTLTLGSFFKGSKDKLVFSSSSHQRMYKDTNETDTCEISYYLEADRDDSTKMNLMKRESTFIDESPEEGGSVYVLAEDVDNLQFRYLRPKTQYSEAKWVEVWDSTQGDFIYRFPSAVEVSIELLSPANKEKRLKLVQRIRILNPNNLSKVVANE